MSEKIEYQPQEYPTAQDLTEEELKNCLGNEVSYALEILNNHKYDYQSCTFHSL